MEHQAGAGGKSLIFGCSKAFWERLSQLTHIFWNGFKPPASKASKVFKTGGPPSLKAVRNTKSSRRFLVDGLGRMTHQGGFQIHQEL